MTSLELMDSLIKFRKTDNTFQRSIDERSKKMTFRFFDGPPFSSGTPHYGHLLAGTIKDVIPRYMTMRGYQVKRKRGRDCHGLPVEKAVEKALWIDGKRDIETKIWIESFVEKCRAYVSDTNDAWKRFIDHTARRADIENEYRTMDLDFMESVIYCFSKIYNDNLVYKGFKVQRYCPSCATPLANNEVSDGYKDKTDSAITVKFQLDAAQGFEDLADKHEFSPDGCLKCVRAVIKNDKGEILQLFSTKVHRFLSPGGKIDKGDTPETAIIKELQEELGITTTKINYLWAFKFLRTGPYGWCILQYIFEVEVDGDIQNLEPKQHEKLLRVKVEPNESSLWFQLVLEDNIITDEEEIQNQFTDLYFYLKQLPQKLSADSTPLTKGGSDEGAGGSGEIFWNLPAKSSEIFFLARTTTPRTLPSNMFLATGADIPYSMVYDFDSKEYYILATNLLKKYYKNPEDYITIRTFKGKDLQGLHYKPLFDYIPKAFSSTVIASEAEGEAKQSITTDKSKYLPDFFQILNADFVSTEDGTGIVHIAPTFGEEDFRVVAQLLWGENALERLFMPVNEYGEFDEQVYDYTGRSVLDVNKDIIDRLKTEGTLIKSESITHSYPHCRRCHTPLISKAMSSRFIKEQEMNAQTRQAAEKINFVPEGVKNRFVNGLQQAPDRNIARNRYRGSPLPIWQNVDDENDHFTLGTLEEIYQFSRTGSKNITKHILIRHAKTDYNAFWNTAWLHDTWLHDTLGKAKLNDEGKQQAKNIAEQLNNLNFTKEDTTIVISPLGRTRETILPFLQTYYTKEEIENIDQAYKNIQQKYLAIYAEGNFIDYVQNDQNELHFEIWKNIFVDFRITDTISPGFQDKVYPTTDANVKLSDFCHGDTQGETHQQRIQRNQNYIKDINQKYPTHTVITVSHWGPLTIHKQCFLNFDYKNRGKYVPKHAEVSTWYRDNDRNTSVDLHKPYVDNYRGIKDWKTYKRIPEVMDCRFESGAMPFGQEHYIGDTTPLQKGGSPDLVGTGGSEQQWTSWRTSPTPPSEGGQQQTSFTADFIAEGLDQTRGRFRTLHILGHAIKGENAMKNVVVNGIILAEDGKKMSKSLKNYPDPQGLIEKRGGDSFRLHVLASPSVKAEPMKFNEKDTEQAFKDFTLPLQNVFNFFETYAKIDNRKSDGTEVRFMRHAESDTNKEDPNHMIKSLNHNWKASLESKEFIEKILRINPDVIIDNEFVRIQETAKGAQKVMEEYADKDIEIISQTGDFTKEYIPMYQELLEKHKGKRILIVWPRGRFARTRSYLYHTELNLEEHRKLNNLEVIELPTYQLTNDLDKRILAELNQTTFKVDQLLQEYFLDEALKTALDFVEKLTNRYLRRSRRRFRANGMTPDKHAAYSTLYYVLKRYCQIMAPFTPFITEHLRLQLANFVAGNESSEICGQNLLKSSIHLSFRPIANQHYINKELIDEIATVRKIIKLALFVRAKNKIAVKQPLQKLSIKLD